MPPQRKVKISRRKILLAIIIAAVCLIVFLPAILRQFNGGHTSQAIQKISQHYGLDEHHILGTVHQCIEQGPTNFGATTGIHNCYRTTAVAFFPRISVSDYTQPDGLTMIYYVPQDGTKEEYLASLGYDPEGSIDPSLEEQIEMDAWDHLTISGVSSKYDKKENSNPTRIDGIWQWSSTMSWLGTDTDASRLKDSIDESILNNIPVADGVPTAQEALKNNQAPLIIYITDRYCHSPGLLFLDYACILPN